MEVLEEDDDEEDGEKTPPKRGKQKVIYGIYGI